MTTPLQAARVLALREGYALGTCRERHGGFTGFGGVNGKMPCDLCIESARKQFPCEIPREEFIRDHRYRVCDGTLQWWALEVGGNEGEWRDGGLIVTTRAEAELVVGLFERPTVDIEAVMLS
jgi:hypothetical protein